MLVVAVVRYLSVFQQPQAVSENFTSRSQSYETQITNLCSK